MVWIAVLSLLLIGFGIGLFAGAAYVEGVETDADDAWWVEGCLLDD